MTGLFDRTDLRKKISKNITNIITTIPISTNERIYVCVLENVTYEELDESLLLGRTIKFDDIEGELVGIEFNKYDKKVIIQIQIDYTKSIISLHDSITRLKLLRRK